MSIVFKFPFFPIELNHFLLTSVIILLTLNIYSLYLRNSRTFNTFSMPVVKKFYKYILKSMLNHLKTLD